MPEPQLLVRHPSATQRRQKHPGQRNCAHFEDDSTARDRFRGSRHDRDSVDVRLKKMARPWLVIDTAGVRKKRQMVSSDIEFYSFHRAQRSIRRADVVMMLIDGTDPLSQPDHKLRNILLNKTSPSCSSSNKWDLSMAKAREIRKDSADAEVDDETVDERIHRVSAH